VTAVGATVNIPETATNFSGGGFSNYVSNLTIIPAEMLTRSQFPRPDYQEAAVSEYLAKLAPGTYEGLYNS
jgi:tripeptidyl-peptidase-1